MTANVAFWSTGVQFVLQPNTFDIVLTQLNACLHVASPLVGIVVVLLGCEQLVRQHPVLQVAGLEGLRHLFASASNVGVTSIHGELACVDQVETWLDGSLAFPGVIRGGEATEII